MGSSSFAYQIDTSTPPRMKKIKNSIQPGMIISFVVLNDPITGNNSVSILLFP
jgi:hypothetical protein